MEIIMIELTKLNDQAFILNSDLIEFIEKTPDSVISLTTGRKVVVKESVDEILNKVIKYRRFVREGISIKPE
jgi:flagellar protein FlbD